MRGGRGQQQVVVAHLKRASGGCDSCVEEEGGTEEGSVWGGGHKRDITHPISLPDKHTHTQAHAVCVPPLLLQGSSIPTALPVAP